MKIYFDACCLNRPFDDQSQIRIRLETESVRTIIELMQPNDWTWLSSEWLDVEIEQTPNLVRQNRVMALLEQSDRTLFVDEAMVDRAKHLESLGFKAGDALHIACAESAQADVFLTTDDRLRKRGQRLADKLEVTIANPLQWLAEVNYD